MSDNKPRTLEDLKKCQKLRNIPPEMLRLVIDPDTKKMRLCIKQHYMVGI